MEAVPSFVSLLDTEDVHALEEVMSRRHFQRGSVILHRGEDPASVLMIVAGRVKVSATADDGHETVLAFRGPGDLLGDESAMDGRPRSASVTALEPVDALMCARSDFRRMAAAHPCIGEALLQIVVDRLREADEERSDFGARDVLGRVARRLVVLSERFGEECTAGMLITLPITQDELASWTGASREAVSKALGTFRELGWVDTRRRGFVIRDEQALREYVR
jgi:CRP/FNR family cyclic AMP-dependent transcriptional regulator